MIKNTEKTIDGLKFHVTEFPAFTAIKLKAKLARLLGPAFSSLLSAVSKMEKGKSTSDIDISALAPAIEVLASSLSPDDFAQICLEIFGSTIVIADGTKLELANLDHFNKAFTGRLDVMYKGIYFVLQVNDFFGLSGIGKALGLFASTKAPSIGSSPQKVS